EGGMDVTIYDVARLAGVSPATVSRALNGSGRVAAATRRRVEAAVAQLGYEPNRVARSLATSVTHTLALLLPDITNPFFPALVKGVQLLADERRYTLLLCNTAADPEREKEYLRVLRGKRVDGVILVGLKLDGRRIRSALGNIPVVVLDRSVDLPGAAVVQVDHRGGAVLAVRHLLELGHREVAHVAGPKELAVSRERLEGYRQALEEAGLPYRPQLVVEADFTEEGGYEAVRRLCAAGRFTAVFAANDLSAIGIVAALRERGLTVPDQVSVVGFDDIHLCAYTVPALTTVRQPAYAMGRRAAELLIDAVEGGDPRGVVFQAELVVRGSTAPPLGRRSAG
ncbi:MAG TPA: LacI family DNA-binding transcriptional regulator, partial [Candidatus Dormibacteraeota bacterium]|nr:LacI family DNA-binding transcriptional regulator [Candidatus Dormibacteraeota bacterium]